MHVAGISRICSVHPIHYCSHMVSSLSAEQQQRQMYFISKTRGESKDRVPAGGCGLMQDSRIVGPVGP